MTQALDDLTLFDPAIARRIAALGPNTDLVYRELGLDAVLVLLRYVDTGFRQKPRLQALLWQTIGEEKRRMYMSVYDEMRAEGRAEGRLLGKIEFLVELLSKRGLLLDNELRVRLDRCTDETLLRRWLDRALTATTVAAIFDEP